MTLLQFHAVFANAMLIFSLAYGVWGLLRYARKQAPDASYWGTLAVGQLLYTAQGAVGLALWLGGPAPGRSVHILYGALSLIVLPGAYLGLRAVSDHRASLTFGLVGLFLAGVSLRAMSTAG